MDVPQQRFRQPPTWLTWAVIALAMAGLMVASSSDSVRIWTNPDPTVDDGPAAAVPDDTPLEPADEPDDREPPSWIGTVLQIVAFLLFAGIVAAGAMTLREWRPWLRPGRRRRPAPPPGEWDDTLPDANTPPIDVDTGPALAALSDGPPRNAIIACWIELEHEAASAGLPRLAAETSTEYVERVVGQSLVDPAPITELGALYREARFSVHDLTDTHRDRAAAALARVETGLRPARETST